MILLNTKVFGENSEIDAEKLAVICSVKCQLNPDIIIFTIFASLHQNSLDASRSS